MGFNYAAEKTKFETLWARLRREYRAAGMSDTAIQKMHDFDWEVFKQERIYRLHTQDLGIGIFDEPSAEQENKSALMKKFLYQKKDYIERVKRDLYVAISLETQQPIANRYVIASHISNDAAVSYHSAFEFYGYSNQVFYETQVTSESHGFIWHEEWKLYAPNNLMHMIDKRERATRRERSSPLGGAMLLQEYSFIAYSNAKCSNSRVIES